MQSLGLHTAVSLRVPVLHDLCPDKVYPVLQVGEQEDPCARIEVQPGPAAPLEMESDASHVVHVDGRIVRTLDDHEGLEALAFSRAHSSHGATEVVVVAHTDASASAIVAIGSDGLGTLIVVKGRGKVVLSRDGLCQQ